jgi:CRISPR-associated protein Csb1
MLEALRDESRLLMEVELRPVQGNRFQPTGFADLGAADYVRPDGTRMLLVESAQSMANRLEAACLDGNGPHIAGELKGLPYVVARLDGAVSAETSSLVEAHRINSPYIISDKDFQARLATETGYRKGGLIDWHKVAAAVFRFDPNSVLHGVFMSNFEDGRIRLSRVLSGFIEAEDIREAASGGVKNNPLDPSGTIRAVGFDKDVYGNVPYHRTEYTARRVSAYFNLDLALLAGYGLEDRARKLLLALALYKIRRFLSTGMRLRTACDLEPVGDLQVTRPTGFVIPGEPDLLSSVKTGIEECKELFPEEVPTVIATRVVEKKRSEAASEGESEEAAASEDSTSHNG